MDKTSFDRLNKLFVISARERNHETLLIEENLLKLVWDPKLYSAPSSFPHFVPRVLVPDEHYVVKDLPFYVESWTVDAKKREDRLVQREKKMLKGDSETSFGWESFGHQIYCPSSFQEEVCSSACQEGLGFISASFFFVGDSSGSPSVGDSSDQEPEPIVPFIDLELEKEEEVKDMTPKLKAGFKERHRKHLSEALPVAPPPAKKVCPKAPS